MRWGIEIQFRTFKQTFGGGQLRSKTPDPAMIELHWSLLGLWMIQLFAVKEQIEIGAPPEHSSASQAIRVIHEMLMRWPETPGKGQDMQSKLRLAVIDQYQRPKQSKQSRYRPFNKNKPATGKPVITIATKRQKLRLKQCLNLAT
jgi:hypothetical protein